MADDHVPDDAAPRERDEAEKAHAEQLRRIVLRKSVRRERARRERDQSIWAWLGTFGLVGWTVAVPTLLGLALGRFLDNRVAGPISFTITFLVVGVAVGIMMAWRWVRNESPGGDRDVSR